MHCYLLRSCVAEHCWWGKQGDLFVWFTSDKLTNCCSKVWMPLELRSHNTVLLDLTAKKPCVVKTFFFFIIVFVNKPTYFCLCLKVPSHLKISQLFLLDLVRLSGFFSFLFSFESLHFPCLQFSVVLSLHVNFSFLCSKSITRYIFHLLRLQKKIKLFSTYK